MAADRPRIALVWRGDDEAAERGLASNERLRPVADALIELGAVVEPVVYRDAVADDVRGRLLAVDGALVWVDPIGGGETRARLDEILRDVAGHDVWVSAHPDVIAAIGTKDVLFDTRQLSWSADVHRYDDIDGLRSELPARLATSGARVLKQRRGNGGIGVWRVELLTDGTVSVHHAQQRDTVTEELALVAFLARCEPYFDDGGCLIDQAFQPRVAEGIIRAYLVGDRVVGFAHQGPGDLGVDAAAAGRIMGLPSPKQMLPVDHRPLQGLRRQVEDEWVPAMQRVLAVATERLPVLWDADFLLGPKTADGDDTHVLCEINASCVTPFPPEAPAIVARATMSRVSGVTRRGRGRQVR